MRVNKILLFGLLVVFTLTSANIASARVTIDVWSWRIEDVEAYNKMFEVFEKENPDIKINFVAYQDSQYETILGTALRAGRGPDIAQLKPYGELQPFVNAGFIEPLDDKIDELAAFYPVALDGARSTADDRIYGVPYSVPNMGIFYNTEIFEQHGIQLPKTWQEFIGICEQLKQKGVIPIAAGGASGSGWALEIMIGVFGPNLYGGNEFWDEITSGKTDFTDPRFVRVLERLQELQPYLSPGFEGIDYTTAAFQFMTGQAAMFVGGSFENGNFKAQNPDLKFSIFPAPPENADEPAYTSSFADGSYGLVRDSKHPEEALRVLKFMASLEFAQMFADYLGWPPARPGVDTVDPVLKAMIEMEKTSTPYLTLVGFRWDTPTASSLVQSTIVPLLAGRMTADEVARYIQDGVSTWYEPFRN